jgi:hypothetical protein
MLCDGVEPPVGSIRDIDIHTIEETSSAHSNIFTLFQPTFFLRL